MKNEIGARIRLYRQSRGLSQENMANELDLSIAAYSNIERGVTDINHSRIVELAKIFEISPAVLINDDLYLTPSVPTVAEQSEVYSTKTVPADVFAKLKELQKENEQLYIQIEYLKEINLLLKQQSKTK